jgi:glucose/arabinose dehydrogenase
MAVADLSLATDRTATPFPETSMTPPLSSRGLAIVLALAATPVQAAVLLPSQFISETVVSGLAEPNSMAFLPDGRLLFTEQRNGKVRMVVNGHIAVTDPMVVVTSLNASGYERGLQGIAVDPRWPASPYVYVYYNRAGAKNRLIRYTASGDVTNPSGENVTLGSPLLLIDDVADNNPNHNSGCLRFGADGRLYVSVGEDEDWCSADDPKTLKGQILRLDVSRLPVGGGGPVPRAMLDPGDNPLAVADSNARLVYAYGLRNPWRFHLDQAYGRVYAADVGEDIVEELDEIASGDYLGWPYREGNTIVQRANCPEPGGPGTTPYKAPILLLARNTDLTAIIEAGVYRHSPTGASNWPREYAGQLFYGEYYGGYLRRLQRNVQGVWSAPAPAPGQPNANDWGTGFKSAVDFLVGPDGSMWCLRQFNDSMAGITGSLQRIRYVGAPVDAPHAGPRVEVLASQPNPFARDVTLSFRLSTRGVARLRVFDLGGRTVRWLVNETLPAGEHRFDWDGLDSRRRATPPGVYLARLETPDGTQTIRMLRLE